jgi:hypothetical protein
MAPRVMATQARDMRIPARAMVVPVDSKDTRVVMAVPGDLKETREDGVVLPTKDTAVPRDMEIPRDLDMRVDMKARTVEVIMEMGTRVAALLTGVILTRIAVVTTEMTAGCNDLIRRKTRVRNPEHLLPVAAAVLVLQRQAVSAGPVQALQTVPAAPAKKADAQNKFSFIRAGEWRSLPRFLKK